jgi:hypothetical protein
VRCRDLQDKTGFLSWIRANSAWLQPYTAFSFLRDLLGTADHRQWGVLHGNPIETVRRITAPTQSFHCEILFLYWLQWNLHKQLLEASMYARQKRVVLKGDLPIGVAKCSADTWCHPNLFHMDVSVGSPPDAFDAKGQNWGFPGATFHCFGALTLPDQRTKTSSSVQFSTVPVFSSCGAERALRFRVQLGRDGEGEVPVVEAATQSHGAVLYSIPSGSYSGVFPHFPDP